MLNTHPHPEVSDDSPLMLATLAGARLLVNMKEGSGLSDEMLTIELQAMIDAKVIDLFYASVGFVFNLVKEGRLSPPVRGEARASPSSSGIILPASYQ